MVFPTLFSRSQLFETPIRTKQASNSASTDRQSKDRKRGGHKRGVRQASTSLPFTSLTLSLSFSACLTA